MRTMKSLALAVMTAAALALAGCGGGGSGTTAMMPTPPTPYETAVAAIAAATTADEAQAAVDAAADDVSGTELISLQAAADARADALAMMARAAEQIMTLMTTAANVDTSGLMTAADIAAAQTAIDALQAALDAAVDVSDANKATYQTQLDAANSAVQMAQAALDLAGDRDSQMMALTTASDTLTTALGALSSPPTQAQIDAAQAALDALNAAIEAAADLTDAEKAAAQLAAANAEGRIEGAEQALAAAIAAEEERQRLAAEAEAKERAAKGKALKGALGTTPLDYAVGPAATSPLTGSGLVLNYDADQAGAGAAVDTPRMRTGASAGSLGDWAGTHYSHTNAGTKVTNSAVVYTNRAAAKSYPIASRYAVADNRPANAGDYTAASRMLALGDAADPNIKADEFPTAGQTTFTPTSPSSEILVPGTYQGAPGDYRCDGTCTATAGASGVITLSADWVFIHDMGAMVSVSDPNYLYFGWWLQTDKDGEPDYASAFVGVQGDVDGDQTLTDPTTLSGSATYNGHAAGKFAIYDPLTATGDAGHFTADATLTARFGTAATAGANNSNGLFGTLDNFMANDQSVPWSVSLLRANLNATGGTVAFDDPDTSGVNEETDMTVWSIDGNSAAADGTWSGQLYDEKPGNAPTGDGSNVATSVTGTFQSHYGSTHTMVGAFGATAD